MKKLIILFIALFGIGLMGALILMSSFGGFGFNTVSLYEEKVLENDKIEQIEVTHTSTDVKIIPTKDQNMTVELNGKVSKRVKDQYKLEVKEDGEKVKIAVIRDDNEWFSIFDLNNGNVDLNLKFRKKYMNLLILIFHQVTWILTKSRPKKSHLTPAQVI